MREYRIGQCCRLDASPRERRCIVDISITKFGNTRRLVLVGDLDISGAEKLGLPLATLAGSGGGLVVDMTSLDSIAAIGIRHLVRAALAMRRRSGRLVVLCPNAAVTDMLIKARVDDLLLIVRSDDEACWPHPVAADLTEIAPTSSARMGLTAAG
jgi:anti-anti-sigma factor